MVFRVIPAPSAILVVIPLVIIIVVFIIDSDLDVGFLRHRGSHNCHRRRKDSGQEKRGQVSI